MSYDVDYFPNLKIKALKTYAEEWADYFNGILRNDIEESNKTTPRIWIQRIVLYKLGLDVPYGRKYALVFEISELEEKHKRQIWYYDSLFRQIESFDVPMFIGKGNDFFDEIYKTSPKNKPTDEWFFKCQISGSELDVGAMGKSEIVLCESLQQAASRLDMSRQKIPKIVDIIPQVGDDEDFPELKLSHLRRYANRWVDLVEGIPIKRVILYRYYSKFRPYFEGKISTKYIVVFELFFTDEYTVEVFKSTGPDSRSISEVIESIQNEGNESQAVKNYKEFVGFTGHRQCGPKEFRAFIDETFPYDVYTHQPEENFRKDWRFIPKRPDEGYPLGVAVNEPCWILYEKMINEKLNVSKPEKKLRANQRHRLACREVARKKWREDPTLTIKNLIFDDALNKVCEGKLYAEGTIRGWIKDLCPNRSPGRRPKR